MKSDELRNKAKEMLERLVPGNGIDTDELVDLLIEAAVAEITENHMVDVPNTGYFGIIVKKEP